MRRDEYARALRRRSGSVTTRDPIAYVLERVLRCHLTAEAFEELLCDAELCAVEGATFTDGWTAAHAIDAAKRLRKAVR